MSQLLELIKDLGPPFNFVAFICLFFAVASVIGSVVKQSRKYLCHRQEIEFKREMLDRGMSAEEIESVVRVRGEQTKAEE
jgi:hypothetical protein